MRKLLLVAVFFWRLIAAKGQDINFSQFYELPLLRNPATAGLYTGDFRITSAFRNQWMSVTTPYKTMAVGLETRLPIRNSNDYVSLGFQLTQDQAGDSRLTKTQMLPMLAYHKSLDPEKDAYVTLGVLSGGVQQRFDMSALRFSDQFVGGAYSPSNPTRQNFQNTSQLYWDVAVGLCYSSIVGEDLRFYTGAAFFHFNEPNVAFSSLNDIKLNKKYVVTVGLSSAVYTTGRLIIYGDFFAQGGNSQLQCGAFYQHYVTALEAENAIKLSLGGIYRWNDAAVPTIRLDYGRVGAGFSYDVNISKLTKASYGSGGMELTLSYRGFYKNNSATSRMRCPVNMR